MVIITLLFCSKNIQRIDLGQQTANVIPVVKHRQRSKKFRIQYIVNDSAVKNKCLKNRFFGEIRLLVENDLLPPNAFVLWYPPCSVLGLRSG